MTTTTYSPLIIFAFNRLEPLKQTVASVLRNREASETDLFVFVDGARQQKEGELEKVMAVQEYVRTITGFKSVNHVFSDQNKGLGRSIISGVTSVVDTYGRAIVLEDDLVVAGGFLSYMNTMLDAYRNDSRIMQVTGFSTKLHCPSDYQHDVYLNRRGESWSWATWADRWHSVDWEVGDYKEFISDKKRQKAFNGIGSDLTGMLKGYKEGRNESWAVRLCYEMFKSGRYTVAPVRSLVRNEGFNADATNCRRSYNIYKYDFNDVQMSFAPVADIRYERNLDRSANRYWTICYRIYGKIISLLYNYFRR